MPTTYTDPDGTTLTTSRCDDGVHLHVESSAGRVAAVCVALKDVAQVAEDLRGWAAVGADTEFPATWAGGHALVTEFGDEEIIAHCQCGEPFGCGTPATPLDHFGRAWEQHVMAVAASFGG